MPTTVVRNDLPKLPAELRRLLRVVVSKTALDVEGRAKQDAPVDTGFLRSSIGTEDGETELTKVVAAKAEYAVHVEYGTHKAAAQPFLTPAAEAVRPGFNGAVQAVLDRLGT